MDPFDLRLWDEYKFAIGTANDENPFIDQVVIDSRQISSPHALFVALPGEREDGHNYVAQAASAGARYAIVRQDWQVSKLPEKLIVLRVKNPLRSLQDIAKAYRKQLKALIIAIIGTHGKTMVKDLLQMMTATSKKVTASPGSFNSQIGVPLSLLQITREHEIALIEAAVSEKNEMNHLAAMILPDGCILTHLGKKHLATLGNQQNMAAEIVKLLIDSSSENWVLMPHTNLIQKYLGEIKAQQFFWNVEDIGIPHAFPLSQHYNSSLDYCIKFPDKNYYEGVATAGFYYYMDLLNITVKAAWILGITSETIIDTLRHYKLEPMRTEIWKSPLGTTFINDTYCSDVQSIDRALKYFDQSSPDTRKIFIFGGMKGNKEPKSSAYKTVAQAIIKNKVQLLALVGGAHDFRKMIDLIKRQSPQTEIYHYDNYPEALQQMKGYIKQNDNVLIKR